jgi:hypothetical protein
VQLLLDGEKRGSGDLVGELRSIRDRLARALAADA